MYICRHVLFKIYALLNILRLSAVYLNNILLTSSDITVQDIFFLCLVNSITPVNVLFIYWEGL